MLLEPHLPDIELLEQVTGESFEDWKGYRDGGSFESRRRLGRRTPVGRGRRHRLTSVTRSCAPSGRATSK